MKRARIASALVFSSLLLFGVTMYANEEHPSALFKQYCAVCHGEDGKGQTPKGKQLNARDLTDPEWQEKEDDEEIIQVITEGEMDMPAWGKKLTKEQIESLAKKDVRGFAAKN